MKKKKKMKKMKNPAVAAAAENMEKCDVIVGPGTEKTSGHTLQKLLRGKKLFRALVSIAVLYLGITFPEQEPQEIFPELPDSQIVVLYTNDVHCGLDDNIGYEGLKQYELQMLQETPYVSLVDAGDAIQGAPAGQLSRGEAVIGLMNRMGYDVAVPGNHEFDYGMERFLQLAGELECGYVCSNFLELEDQEAVLPPYRILSYGDTQVAFVGAATPESLTKSSPASFRDEEGAYRYSFCEEETGEELYENIQASVDEARQEGADYVILVGHLGGSGSTEQWSSDSVLENTSGIDVCIDGHSHEEIPGKVLKNEEGETVLLTQTGTKLQNIGRLVIHPNGEIETSLIGQETLEEEIKEDTKEETIKIKTYINEIQSKNNEFLNTVMGSTEFGLTIQDPVSGRRAVRNAETNLGDLAADIYRYGLDAQIGLAAGGGIRDSIPKGTITRNSFFSVFPHNNRCCVIKATGQQILDALEMGARNYPGECSGFLQVSGLTLTIDASIPSSVRLDRKGNFLGVEGSRRVREVRINGKALDPAGIYEVASNEYLLLQGGDGMTMFPGGRAVEGGYADEEALFRKFLEKQPEGVLGKEYADPAGQGRIKIFTKKKFAA